MNTVVVAWLGAAIGIAGFTLAQVVYSWQSHRVRRYHARFPMFAARDALVELVANGTMEENDPAWALAYTGCNVWLSPKTRHSLWSELLTRMSEVRKRRSDTAAAERAECLKNILVARAIAVPAFGEAIIQSDDARRELIRGRTHWWDRVALRLFYYFAIAFAACFMGAAGIARALGRKKPAQESRAQAERFVPVHPREVYSTSRHEEPQSVDIEASIGKFVAWNIPISWKTTSRERRVTAS